MLQDISSIQSAISSLLILHQKHGLWHSYRMALLIDQDWEQEDFSQTDSPHVEPYQAPCNACVQPCLSACPVNAFATAGTYDVALCRAYVRDNPQSDCHQTGCQARLACPEGQGSHELAQHQYHMSVFAKG